MCFSDGNWLPGQHFGRSDLVPGRSWRCHGDDNFRSDDRRFWDKHGSVRGSWFDKKRWQWKITPSRIFQTIVLTIFLYKRHFILQLLHIARVVTSHYIHYTCSLNNHFCIQSLNVKLTCYVLYRYWWWADEEGGWRRRDVIRRPEVLAETSF